MGILKDQDKRQRTTIIQFTNRSTRDLLWRRAKNCEFLIKQKLRFTEDLTSADKVTRETVADGGCSSKGRENFFFFNGARVIIDGERNAAKSEHLSESQSLTRTELSGQKTDYQVKSSLLL